MRRVGCLFERVVAWTNLLIAAKKAARGKRSRPVVARFFFNLEFELIRLQRELETGKWAPGPCRTFSIRDPKPRRISAAPFRDRVVHHAIMNVLGPVFEACLISHTFACRRGMGTHRAVESAQRLSRRYRYFLKGDVQSYFESVDHEILKGLLRCKIKDRRLLDLLGEIVDGPGAPAPDGRGLPIGSLTSQYFANHYLGQLDLFVKQGLRCRGYLRYMDDFVLFAAEKETLHLARGAIREFLSNNLKLTLKEYVTCVAPCSRGLPFLGFNIFPGVVRLQGSRRRRTLRKIKEKEAEMSLGCIGEEQLARSVASSIAHVSHARTVGLRRRWFAESEY